MSLVSFQGSLKLISYLKIQQDSDMVLLFLWDSLEIPRKHQINRKCTNIWICEWMQIYKIFSCLSYAMHTTSFTQTKQRISEYCDIQ